MKKELRFSLKITLVLSLAVLLFVLVNSLQIPIQSCSAEDSIAKGSFSGICNNSTGASLLFDDTDYETHTYGKQGSNLYAGVKISSYNSSITNCKNITSVKLCYKWWTSHSSPLDCDISVSVNGGVNFTAVTTNCPGLTEPVNITCTDITSLMPWGCSNFFGVSGVKAQAKSENARISSGSGSTETTTWDVFYFDINYTLIANDTTNPRITIIFPINNSVSSDVNLDVNYSASDNVALSSCWYSNDTMSVNTTITCGQNITTVVWSSGQHNVTVWANDTSNNVNKSSVRFFLDSISPNIFSVFSTNITNQSSEITWMTDENSNSSVNYGITLSLGLLSGQNDNVSDHLVILENLVEDTIYYYNITSCDSYHNCKTSETYNFTTSQTQLAQNITINESVEDAFGNLINVTIEIIDELDNSTVYKQTGTTHATKIPKNKKYKIRLIPENHKIKTIEFKSVNITEDLNQLVDIDDPSDNQDFNYLYAINPVANLSADTVFTVTSIASANSRILYKCASWNFTSQNCTGNWTAWQAISSGQEYSVSLTLNDPGLAEGDGTFFDGFELGNLDNWTLTNTSNANNWDVQTLDPYAGTYYAQSNPRAAGENSTMEILVNTSGYRDINFSYYRKLIGLDSVDWFKAWWYDGSIWILLEETNSVGDSSYVYKYFALSSSANNNPNLKVRFQCVAGAVTEYCRVDNVVLNGGLIPIDTTPPIINSFSDFPDPVVLGIDIKINSNVTDDFGVSSVWVEINDSNYTMTQKLILGDMLSGIIFDGFESGTLATNSWILSGTGEYWASAIIDPLSGLYHSQAHATGAGDPSYMELAISTSGYTNINFSYNRKLVGLDAADDFSVEWYNGTNWIILEKLGTGIEDNLNYVSKIFNLSSDADNNANFRIRFMCEVGAVSEYCRVDNVNITGILSLSPTEIWEYEHTPFYIGGYNYTIYANDTSGNNAVPEKGNFTVIESNVTIVETVRDSSGISLNTTILILNESNDLMYNETKITHYTQVGKGLYNIQIKPKNHKIIEIKYNSINLSADVNNFVDIDDPSDNQGFNYLYVVNPLIGNSSNNDTFTITSIASANSRILYKCASWNFTSQNCTGNWTAWQAINPGQKYNVTFVVEDPGLAEGNGTFFDGFESGSFSTNNWTSSGALKWQINNKKADRYAGLNYMESINTGGVEDIIETNVSTVGYNNLAFSFAYKTLNLVAGDYVAADYYNGTDWVEVLNTLGSTTWTLSQNNLGSDSSDNPNFRIRFRCKNDLGSEKCYIDNAQLVGNQITDLTPPNLLIVHPLNNINLSDSSIDINYTVGNDSQACWYSNDSMSLNISITCGQNITSIIWSEGQHNVTIWANDSSGNQNYSSVSFTIDTLAPYFIDGTLIDQTLSYELSLGYDLNATDSREFGCFSVNDTRFSINCNGLLQNIIVLGVSEYYLNVTINDTMNNLNSSVLLINVTKSNPSLGMNLIITPSSNVIYGTQTSATGSESNTGDGDLLYRLYRNHVLFSNPDTSILNAGTYDYVYNTTGGQNYTAGSISSILIVNQSSNAIFLLLNGASNDLTLQFTQQINASVFSDSGVFSLYRNNTFVSGENGLNVTLGIGFYEYFANSSGNINYLPNLTGILFSVNVTDIPDTIGPAIIIYTPNQTVHSNNIDINLNYSVNDSSGVDSCWYNINNGSNVFILNCQNTTFNVSGEGTYELYFFSNDTLGNEKNRSAIFWVDTTGISLSVSEPKGIKNSRKAIPIKFSTIGNNLSCGYNVKTSVGGIVIGNTTLPNCSNSSFDVSTDGDFIFYLYSNNSFGTYNFTNLSFSILTSSEGSGSVEVAGGGGGSSVLAYNKLSLGNIKGIIAEPGKNKKVGWIIKNIGINFLNDCNIKGDGNFSSWIYPGEVRNLAGGEEYSFFFNVNVPELTKAGKYNLTVSINCKEISKSTNFVVEILERKLGFDLIEVKRENQDSVKIVYSIEEFSGLDQNVVLQFLLFGQDNQLVSDAEKKEFIPSNSKKQFEVTLPVDPSLRGALNLLINLNSETYSTFIQENIILGSPIGGFAIFGEPTDTDNLISGIFIFLFLAFSFVVLRNIFRSRKKIRKGYKKKPTGIFQKFFWKLFPKKDRRGVMLVDTKMLDSLIVKVSGRKLNGKYIKII